MQKKLGILGGGQLGRMLIQSATDFNIQMGILDSQLEAPASSLAKHFVQGDLLDEETVYAFGQDYDLISIEIEKVNTAALKRLEAEGKEVYPQAAIIELIQDKGKQKEFYRAQGFPTADFLLLANKEELLAQTDFLPAVQKLRRDGYDGKGVQVLRQESDLGKAFEAPSVLEKLVDIQQEIAVIVARSASGEIRTYPAVEMIFHPEANLVEYLFSPARIAENMAQKADQMAKDLIEKLGMVGLLAVEFFIDRAGNLLVNEVAPRPHNSGHQSIEGNVCSQFEQHLRAIYNWPLGDSQIQTPSIMLNLLGEEGFHGLAKLEGLKEVLAISGVHLHLYGKEDCKPFRKMGHITVTDQNLERLMEKARFVKNTLKIRGLHRI